MMKRKVLIPLLLGMMTMQSFSAYAVTEPLKTMQYSLRNVQATIEVIQNILALGTSMNMSTLQGMIGGVVPKMPEVKSMLDPKEFASTLPSEMQNLVKGEGAISQVRSYVEQELKSLDLKDPVGVRDALNAVNERLNISAKEAIALGKAVAAKSNKAVGENKELLSNAAAAKDQQSKEAQEAAMGIKALENDAVYNQLSSRLLETNAQRLMARVRTSTDKDASQTTTATDASANADAGTNVSGGAK